MMAVLVIYLHLIIELMRSISCLRCDLPRIINPNIFQLISRIRARCLLVICLLPKTRKKMYYEYLSMINIK